MSSTKTLTEKEFVRLLLDKGYKLDKSRGKGSHKYYVNDKGDWIMYSRKVSKPMIQRLCKQHNLLSNDQRKDFFYNIVL